MKNLRLHETARPWFQNSRPRLKCFYQFWAWDLTSKKSEPQTQSAKNFEIIVQIKQNKMTENASGS